MFDDAAILAIHHTRRIKSLTIQASRIPTALENFLCHAPLLEELDIWNNIPDPALDSALSKGDLSSLRRLRLCGVIPHLPWNNLANLRVFNVRHPRPFHSVTQLLDLFETAPLLHTVQLVSAIDNSPPAPPGRIVPLRHIKVLAIHSGLLPHSTLLRHLIIPTGVSLVSHFCSDGMQSPLLDYLPETSPHLGNLSHVTSINLSFDPQLKFAQFNGPSGSLCVLAVWGQRGDPHSYSKDRKFLRSLGHQCHRKSRS